MIEEYRISPLDKFAKVYNSPNPESAMKVACNHLLRRLNLNIIPIGLKPITKSLNIKVIYDTKNSSSEAAINLTDSGLSILLNPEINWRRNRFSIAHEIAHIIIFKSINSPIFDDDDTKELNQEIEQLCQIGASELLIPQSDFLNILMNEKLTSKLLRILYDNFMVSYEAIFYKFFQIFSCNVIVWKQYARKSTEKKEFRVFNHFPKYKYSDKRLWLPNGCTTKHLDSNIIADCFEKKTTIQSSKLGILLNNNVQYCYSIAIPFPEPNKNLPIFENYVVRDEKNYENCVLQLIFKDESQFSKMKKFIL